MCWIYALESVPLHMSPLPSISDPVLVKYPLGRPPWLPDDLFDSLKWSHDSIWPSLLPYLAAEILNDRPVCVYQSPSSIPGSSPSFRAWGGRHGEKLRIFGWGGRSWGGTNEQKWTHCRLQGSPIIWKSMCPPTGTLLNQKSHKRILSLPPPQVGASWNCYFAA